MVEPIHKSHLSLKSLWTLASSPQHCRLGTSVYSLTLFRMIFRTQPRAPKLFCSGNITLSLGQLGPSKGESEIRKAQLLCGTQSGKCPPTRCLGATAPQGWRHLGEEASFSSFLILFLHPADLLLQISEAQIVGPGLAMPAWN